MKKLLSYLDFAKGKKTALAAGFTIAAMILNLNGIDVSEKSLMELFNTLIEQLEIIIGACGIIYGVTMKIVRKFN